ncbi:hypothetical protein B0H16DRAFT_1734832 [Mycena metata]|uniref:C2H2-type domain-containing protein n=1 Tax=Mycena metata TaxID=1033252 RepID=A0AAD7HTM3_9AGAR|nr:hypothetical protein B0H16DRAFT_1734832 [Mycena metata]
MRPALPLPADVLLDIAELSTQHERPTLARVSKAFTRLYNPVIYRLNYVGSNAKKFVHSLANNPRLPPLVLKLIFDESRDTLVDVEEWSAVLPAMVNLHYIGIVPTIPLPRHVLPLLTFRLRGFGSTGDVVGPWAELVASQSELEELRLQADFFGVVPGPNQLPRLRLIQGRPADIARCAQHQLKQIWFYRGPPFGRRSLKAADLTLLARSPARLLDIRICARYFTRLLHAAPQMLTTLRHILLDEELDWSNFTIDPHAPVANSIKNFAVALTRAQFPRLESVLLICSRNTADHGSRRRLSRADGAYFLEAFKTYLPGPRFRSLRLFAFDGCVGFDEWGSSAQTTTYLGLPIETQFQHKCSHDYLHCTACLLNTATMPRRLPRPPDEMCSTCHMFSEFENYLCVTCPDHFCHTCVVRRHSSYPLHRIKLWDGFAYAEEIDASSLGLSLRLAHGVDGRCTVPIVERDVPVLTSDSGVLKIDIEFCGCDPLASRRLQLISVGLIPSDIANEPGAVELRLLFIQQDEEEERVERRREEHRARLKPRAQPRLVLPPLPPRRRRRQPPPDEPPPAPFTDEQQSMWEAGWTHLPAIARAWSAGELAEETLEDDVIPSFQEFLAWSAPPVPLRGLPGSSNFAENATAGYAQLLVRVERLRQADEQRRKAWELLTSPMWQEHEKTFTTDWYRVSPR